MPDRRTGLLESMRRCLTAEGEGAGAHVLAGEGHVGGSVSSAERSEGACPGKAHCPLCTHTPQLHQVSQGVLSFFGGGTGVAAWSWKAKTMAFENCCSYLGHHVLSCDVWSSVGAHVSLSTGGMNNDVGSWVGGRRGDMQQDTQTQNKTTARQS